MVGHCFLHKPRDRRTSGVEPGTEPPAPLGIREIALQQKVARRANADLVAVSVQKALEALAYSRDAGITPWCNQKLSVR